MIAPWVPGILQRAATIGLQLTVTNGVLSYTVPTELTANVDVIELLWDIGQVREDVVDALTGVPAGSDGDALIALVAEHRTAVVKHLMTPRYIGELHDVVPGAPRSWQEWTLDPAAKPYWRQMACDAAGRAVIIDQGERDLVMVFRP